MLTLKRLSLCLIGFGLLSCTATTTSTTHHAPPGSSNYASGQACGDEQEMCLRSMQEAASVRCLPLAECGASTIEEGGKCLQTSQCTGALKCCTKGLMQAAEHLRCHAVDDCAPGTIN